VAAAAARPDLPDGDLGTLRTQMRACLDNKAEKSPPVRKQQNSAKFISPSTKPGDGASLSVMATEFDTDPEAVDAAMDAVQTAEDDDDRRDAEYKLRKALEAPRTRLLTQFNALAGRGKVPRRHARGTTYASRAKIKRLEGPRAGLTGHPRVLVRRRLSSNSASINWDDTPAALLGKTHRVRGRPRHRGMAGPQEPTGLRSPLLRVLSPPDAAMSP
jgi:hypothetical protein